MRSWLWDLRVSSLVLVFWGEEGEEEKTARPSAWEEGIGRAEPCMRERKTLGWIFVVVVGDEEEGGGGALMRTVVSCGARREASQPSVFDRGIKTGRGWVGARKDDIPAPHKPHSHSSRTLANPPCRVSPP